MLINRFSHLTTEERTRIAEGYDALAEYINEAAEERMLDVVAPQPSPVDLLEKMEPKT